MRWNLFSLSILLVVALAGCGGGGGCGTSNPAATSSGTAASDATVAASDAQAAARPAPGPPPLTLKQQLGDAIFADTNLSNPAGMACETCHGQPAGWADPRGGFPTSQGVVPGRFTSRNAPSAAYASFSPTFHFDNARKDYVGGQFWDGHAATLVDQAQKPFLGAVEMNNSSESQVVAKVRAASYAPLFKQVYGNVTDDHQMYVHIGDALAAYMGSSDLVRFTSKFDNVQARRATFTANEARGFALFTGKAKCATCHAPGPGPGGAPPVFTDFTYHNLGIPKNFSNPFLNLPASLNPDGVNFIDIGLANVTGRTQDRGRFKTPTLRNVASSGPYFHNGIFPRLEDVVHFYNTRDRGGFAPPEVPQTVERGNVGRLGLTPGEEGDLVAFLRTLTDAP